MFKTIEKFGEGLVIEKGSKFIAKACYVETEEEAEDMLDKTKRKYHDARHNCYAYRVLKDGSIVQRQSDDRRTVRDSRSSNSKYIAKERAYKCDSNCN